MSTYTVYYGNTIMLFYIQDVYALQLSYIKDLQRNHFYFQTVLRIQKSPLNLVHQL